MEGESIAEVVARLRLWCSKPDYGFARVEWDSVYSRTEVLRRLRDAGLPITDIELPRGGDPYKTVCDLVDRLRLPDVRIASITGMEWAYPEGGRVLDLLSMLSFRRETLASLPLQQIWWIPATITPDFVIGVPDLDSWFRIKLHLTEVLLPLAGTIMDTIPSLGWTVDEATALAKRFWDRHEKAASIGVPATQIWTDLAAPAIDALQAVGLREQAGEIEALFPGERVIRARAIADERRNQFGPDHPETLLALLNLAVAIVDRGELRAARRLQEKVLDTSQRTLEPGHPVVLSAASNLAATLSAEGDHASARALEEMVVEMSTMRFGPGHPATVAALGNLARTLANQGDLDGARVIGERVLDRTQKRLGPDHFGTWRAMQNLAVTMLRQGDLNSARFLLEQAAAATKKQLGIKHPFTQTVMSNLATTLANLSELKAPEAPDHPDTLLTARELGTLG